MPETESILLIGGGAREHCLAWKLAQSDSIGKIFVCPGNAGTAFKHKSGSKIRNVSVDFQNSSALAQWCRDWHVKLVVVGPEDPLANGLADDLKSEGILCFGPGKAAAQIESSKKFAKSFMDKHNIPTASWKAFNDFENAQQHILSAPYPALVIKASGLAAGKGVIVAESKEEAIAAVKSILKDKIFGSAGDVVVIEEKLVGEEISVLCFTDGETISVMPPAQDHKRLLEGDEGPNTGGMGAYAPCPLVDAKELERIKIEVLQKTVNGLKEDGHPFVGVLFAGIMLTNNGLKVLEFNCRFGDPETEAILPLLDCDLYPIMLACINGELKKATVRWMENMYAVGVVLASKGYPSSYKKGMSITGIKEILDQPKQLLFHSGTTDKGEEIVTNGGRVLVVVSLGANLTNVIEQAQDVAKNILFEGKQFRKDIGHRAISRLLGSKSGLTYKDSGVDIAAGDTLVRIIKPLAADTFRQGVIGSIGGFGGMFDLQAAGFKDPILVSRVNGVGAKLKIAIEMGIHDTIGIDLIALCINDVLSHGAEPLFALDYIAWGKLDLNIAKAVITGIAEACKQSVCALIGGETAEMPGVFAPDVYDLAGFVVGAVERSQLLPHFESISTGDVVIGIPSSGLHCSGFNEVIRLVEQLRLRYTDPAPFNASNSLGSELLTPTKIYVKSLLPTIKGNAVKACAHVTDGGLVESISRILPATLAVHIDATSWIIPAVFGWIAAAGGVVDEKMISTFNCGLGAVLIVGASDADQIMQEIHDMGDIAWKVGHVLTLNNGEPRVQVLNTRQALETSASLCTMVPHIAGDRPVNTIQSQEKATIRMSLKGSGHGFCGIFDLHVTGYKDPILVVGTDGVGTKLKVAEAMGIHDTIGIDLVAMCVNDVLAHGAKPLFFSTYFGCGKIHSATVMDVLAGVTEGCKVAGSEHKGGVTVEIIPGIYDNDVYDLAGFAVGAVERDLQLPRVNTISTGDIVIGIPSSGLHSNGLSLIRKLVERLKLAYTDPAPFNPSSLLGNELLTPTKIYVKSLLPTIKGDAVKAYAHITGGGLVENIPRVLPSSLAVHLDAEAWNIPPVFSWISAAGDVSVVEMLRTLNCGLGAILIVEKSNAGQVIEEIGKMGEMASKVGHVLPLEDGESQVQVSNFQQKLIFPTRKTVTQVPKKKVAVLVSGTGSNLQALIDHTMNPITESAAIITLVISNIDGVQALDRAKRAGIPTKVINHKQYKTRSDFDQALNVALTEENIDIVCLAGFMRILTREFVDSWNGRMLNIHPSLLPSFKGTNAQKQALESGVRITGCSVHFVTAEVDAGAVLVQIPVAIELDDTLETLEARIRAAEHRAFPKALELIASGIATLDSSGKIRWKVVKNC